MTKRNIEKSIRPVTFMLQPSLYEKLVEKCDKEYKTISQVMKDFVIKYVNEEK
jgi:hypothetical protein